MADVFLLYFKKAWVYMQNIVPNELNETNEIEFNHLTLLLCVHKRRRKILWQQKSEPKTSK